MIVQNRLQPYYTTSETFDKKTAFTSNKVKNFRKSERAKKVFADPQDDLETIQP